MHFPRFLWVSWLCCARCLFAADPAPANGPATPPSPAPAATPAGAPAQKPAKPVPDFRYPAPAPVVQAAARKAGISLDGIDAPAARTTLRTGDTTTALVDLTEGKSVQQWVVTLTARDLTEKEKSWPPPKAARMYSSTGNAYEFGSGLAAVAIRTLGPYRVNEKAEGAAARRAKDIRSRAYAFPDLLGLGLERFCRAGLRQNEVMERWRQEGKTLPEFNIGSRGRPYSADEITKGKATPQEFAQTPEEERATAGAGMALSSFFNVVAYTPGLQDVLLSVVDVPWFSILTHGGKMPELSITILGSGRLDWKGWHRDNVYEIHFELKLNGKPALTCKMAVVEPKPPLLTSAGIMYLAAQRPDGKGPHLMIQLISGHCAPEPPLAATP